jgi:hypothetical protein
VTVFLLGTALALAAAARSTWSPCGLSMLSQITPLAEAGRGQRFARTAVWFVAGATLGGLTLGAATAAAALLLAALGLGHSTATAFVACVAFAGATVDTHLLGFGPPFVTRQVNEAWLSKYRPWVYGGGFGWQIGAGVTTYVMTAAVFVMIILAALSASPLTALTIGTIFGLARGLAVLMGARLRSPAALYDFHRRFEARSEPVRQAVIAVQLGVAALATGLVAPALVTVGVSAVAAATLITPWLRSSPTASPASRAASRSGAA